MRRWLAPMLAIPLVAGAAAAANATAIDGAVTGGQALAQGGTWVKLPVPFTESDPDNTVGDDTFQTPNLYVFDEDQNILIPSEIEVDIGTNPQAGDMVASHYVFFDPGPNTTQEGFVDFDAEIFGIVTSRDNLAASDFLANTGVTYLNPGARGLEAGDAVQIDPGNPRRLLVEWRASTPGDYVRVLTMFSPGAEIAEPATLTILGGGLLGLAAWRRRPARRR